MKRFVVIGAGAVAVAAALRFLPAGYSGEACVPTPRPSAAEWHALKTAKLAEAGLPWSAAGEYQLDHMIPACLGGSNDMANLQLQPWPEARQKDGVEALACRLACTEHRISYDQAVEMVRDWRTFKPEGSEWK